MAKKIQTAAEIIDELNSTQLKYWGMGARLVGANEAHRLAVKHPLTGEEYYIQFYHLDEER